MFLFCPLPVTQAWVYFVCILSFHLHEFLFFITCNTHYLCTVDMAEAIKLKIFTSACPSVCLPLSLFCLPPRLRFFACVFSFCLYLFSVFLCVSVSLRVSLASAFISFLSSSVSLFLCVCLQLLPLSLFCLPPCLCFFACVFSFCLYLCSVSFSACDCVFSSVSVSLFCLRVCVMLCLCFFYLKKEDKNHPVGTGVVTSQMKDYTAWTS